MQVEGKYPPHLLASLCSLQINMWRGKKQFCAYLTFFSTTAQAIRSLADICPSKQTKAITKAERTHPRVHVKDLSTVCAHEEEAVAGLINHLKVRAGVGRGHLSFPVVKTAEKWKRSLDDSSSIIATGDFHTAMQSMFVILSCISCSAYLSYKREYTKVLSNTNSILLPSF